MAKILKFVLILAGVGLMIFLYEYLGKELNKPLVGEGFAYGARTPSYSDRCSPK